MKSNKHFAALLTIALVMVVSNGFSVPQSVPDAASTGLLMSAAISALAAVKRFSR